ncbi:hypothetical protein T07_8739 [Trichinella nelsoni]|uniref:Uncharacterized protein n=1 Tax=Trichinella nelsoni TaxID=6336 RepID=A0A0V0S801_9BILA|nr:hypothetical protein T07_8739 [Trichinella nelsoni]
MDEIHSSFGKLAYNILEATKKLIVVIRNERVQALHLHHHFEHWRNKVALKSMRYNTVKLTWNQTQNIYYKKKK